jgi:hypothetical protein
LVKNSSFLRRGSSARTQHKGNCDKPRAVPVRTSISRRCIGKAPNDYDELAHSITTQAVKENSRAALKKDPSHPPAQVEISSSLTDGARGAVGGSREPTMNMECSAP